MCEGGWEVPNPAMSAEFQGKGVKKTSLIAKAFSALRGETNRFA